MTSIELFKEYYDKEKKELEKIAEEYNNQLVKEENPFIKKNLEYFKELNSGGKAVRGTLVKLGYYLEKDNSEYSNFLALAYEVFQTAILVHDDIIDKDQKRRGKETIHYRNYKEYSKEMKAETEAKDLANSIALCMGDYGLYSSNQIISDNYINDSNLGKVLKYFNDMALKTVKGELLDIILPIQSRNNKISQSLLDKSIIDIYSLKTAYYTIVGPLLTGMILAGAPEQKQKEIEKFGEEVGIAFQIQDDILGIYSQDTGKVLGSDIREYKQTVLYSYIQNTEYKEEFLKYYGINELTDEVIKKVQELLEVSGATQHAIDEMNRRYDYSLQLLENIDWIDFDKKEILKGFVEYLRMRNK